MSLVCETKPTFVSLLTHTKPLDHTIAPLIGGFRGKGSDPAIPPNFSKQFFSKKKPVTV